MANKDKVEAKYGNRWFRVCLGVKLDWMHALTYLDLGILPRLLDHHLAPGLCYLLPDYAGQEHQLDAPHRGRAEPVESAGRVRHVQVDGQGDVPWQQALSVAMPPRSVRRMESPTSCPQAGILTIYGIDLIGPKTPQPLFLGQWPSRHVLKWRIASRACMDAPRTLYPNPLCPLNATRCV